MHTKVVQKLNVVYRGKTIQHKKRLKRSILSNSKSVKGSKEKSFKSTTCNERGPLGGLRSKISKYVSLGQETWPKGKHSYMEDIYCDFMQFGPN